MGAGSGRGCGDRPVSVVPLPEADVNACRLPPSTKPCKQAPQQLPRRWEPGGAEPSRGRGPQGVLASAGAAPASHKASPRKP